MIEFDAIPSSIRKPGRYLEFNTSLAVRTLPANRQRTLIVAQRLAAGSVAALIPTAVYSEAEAAAYFGEGSLAHLMVRAAIKANPYLDLTVITLNDGGGAAATGIISLSNNATSAGTLKLRIGTRSIEIAIANGATPASVAVALYSEFGMYSDLPVTADIIDSVVTLTARNKGTVGNQIDIAVDITAQGMIAEVSPMSSGLVDPVLTSALDKVAADQFHIIITPYNDSDSLTALRDHLDFVSGPMEQRPGIGVYGSDTALSTAMTLGAYTNSGRIVSAYLRGTKSPAYEVAAAFGAVLASVEDPAQPLNNMVLRGLAAPPTEQRLTRSEQESCLASGVAPLQVGSDGTVQIVRAITTYTTNAAGAADISLLDVTTIRTLDYVRKACRDRITLRFPRAKLSSRTPGRVRAELVDVLIKLEDLEIVENVKDNLDGLVIERNEQDPNRLDVAIPVDVVNGLHVFAGRIDLLL